MDPFLTPDFWKAQWDTIRAAPWMFVPLLALVAFGVWWLRGRIDDGELRGARAERDAFKSHLDLVKDRSESNAGELDALRKDQAALRRDFDGFKGQIHSAALASVLSSLADAERRAITLTSSNNEIREIVSAPISIREEPIPIISRSTSETTER
jgi:hypothetical protein